LLARLPETRDLLRAIVQEVMLDPEKGEGEITLYAMPRLAGATEAGQERKRSHRPKTKRGHGGGTPCRPKENMPRPHHQETVADSPAPPPPRSETEEPTLYVEREHRRVG
jgi:hypothetical protein